MPYKAEISASSPSCFLFLIDQSTSMAEEISAGEATAQKANGVAQTMNKWLQELSIKCSKSEGIRDYYHVGVIGYGQRCQQHEQYCQRLTHGGLLRSQAARMLR